MAKQRRSMTAQDLASAAARNPKRGKRSLEAASKLAAQFDAAILKSALKEFDLKRYVRELKKTLKEADRISDRLSILDRLYEVVLLAASQDSSMVEDLKGKVLGSTPTEDPFAKPLKLKKGA